MASYIVRFTPDCTAFTPLIQIVDYDFSKKMLPERQAELLALFQPFLDKRIGYIRQFKKPLQKLSLYRDLYKFINKIAIVDKNGKQVQLPSIVFDESISLYR